MQRPGVWQGDASVSSGELDGLEASSGPIELPGTQCHEGIALLTRVPVLCRESAFQKKTPS